MTRILVPCERLPRWVDNFAARHGESELGVGDGALKGTAEDGSTFTARLPFERAYDGPAEVGAFLAAAAAPPAWGVLLVRKGGFAVARLAGERRSSRRSASDTSRAAPRRAASRSSASPGGATTRPARRTPQRPTTLPGSSPVSGPLVIGGDHSAADAVLADPRLAGLDVVGPWLAVPDPKRAVLEAAIRDARRW